MLRPKAVDLGVAAVACLATWAGLGPSGPTNLAWVVFLLGVVAFLAVLLFLTRLRAVTLAAAEPGRRDYVAMAAFGLGVFAALLCLGIATTDVNVDRAHPDAESSRAFCGSAYDVALLKRDGYMGGEYPTDQAEIDDRCLAAARRDMTVAAVPGVFGLAAILFGVRRKWRASSLP